ncbi:Glyoxalase/Bleomycin resistance protein/Dioxygenase superfamily [Schinkia azotoformans MEV2011]|uniref:Glyoxalase/Bleomycin resistance protein/Dioxygenase superfamily n=1 Tax=Schinkia azotoformans MEV2011 TaxID=1348973 RepID=A0A072NTT6_SCHAZ|nr:VOC family protein [Schinkia azotoformans]KEF40313.1 Glyoxalase/Bleomycin resistance protein/Dioxygenase superfamily [Schinkia azotoformans MEV2011]MEC1696378.1 VOC family protein [Schinkia azotoformans]MEC1724050.1 VOC family protein [Schinkia azotoformans]
MFKFHHIGLACKNLEKEIKMHEKLNYFRESQIFEDANQKIKGVFMKNGEFRIELLEALNKDSPINNYLKKGIRMYHQCFTTENLDVAIKFLINEGAVLVAEPIEAVAFNKRKIAFLYLRTQMLIELIEE